MTRTVRRPRAVDYPTSDGKPMAETGIHVVSISFGEPPANLPETRFHDSPGTSLPILYFLALVCILGVYNPPFLERMLADAERFLSSSTASP